jgi:hypothetical protein
MAVFSVIEVVADVITVGATVGVVKLRIDP